MAAYYTFSDLSGTPIPPAAPGTNPLQPLITACDNKPSEITSRYNLHRTTRHAQQTTALLSTDFKGLTPDPILTSLLTDPNYIDPRNCLVLWARPPTRLRELIVEIQSRLFPTPTQSFWPMPSENLHMTALEIAHSRTPAEIEELKARLRPSMEHMADFCHEHRARLRRVMVTCDAQAVAVSFLPAADGDNGDAYTYHHLRRDLWDEVKASGVDVGSRYVVPSAHLTIGRFVRTGVLEDGGVQGLVRRVEEVNEWLRGEFWPGAAREKDGEWVVGEEIGLEWRAGRLWYGGGERVLRGKGF